MLWGAVLQITYQDFCGGGRKYEFHVSRFVQNKFYVISSIMAAVAIGWDFFSPHWPPMFLLIGVEAYCTWFGHKVALNEREVCHKSRSWLDLKPFMADTRSKCACFQPCLVSFLSFCFYVCAPSVLPHIATPSWMSRPVGFRSWCPKIFADYLWLYVCWRNSAKVELTAVCCSKCFVASGFILNAYFKYCSNRVDGLIKRACGCTHLFWFYLFHREWVHMPTKRNYMEKGWQIL